MPTNKPNFELGRDPYTGQFASIKDIFPKHQQEETEPEHLEWRAPEAPVGFRNSQPSPEDILITREEFGDLIEEFIGNTDTDDDFDIWRGDPLIIGMTEDEEMFKTTGHYRSRVGETFVYTSHQFEEWEMEDYRQRKFDELFGADETDETSGIPTPERGEDIQDKFDANEFIEFKKHIIAKVFSRYYLRKLPDGDRQLGSRRSSQDKRRWHQEKYRDAA